MSDAQKSTNPADLKWHGLGHGIINLLIYWIGEVVQEDTILMPCGIDLL